LKRTFNISQASTGALYKLQGSYQYSTTVKKITDMFKSWNGGIESF